MIERLIIVLMVAGGVSAACAVGWAIALYRENRIMLYAGYATAMWKCAAIAAMLWAAAWVLAG